MTTITITLEVEFIKAPVSRNLARAWTVEARRSRSREITCCNEYLACASNLIGKIEAVAQRIGLSQPGIAMLDSCVPRSVRRSTMSLRAVKEIYQTKPTIEGAGVKLQRAFGFGKTQEFDPFLLLDDFRNENPADYLAGFPWHPHRGIETITYVLAGEVAHGDSLGNKGRMTAGDVQWMTAGSGILHQEMPKGDERGRMHGFQLWANLPARLKMTDPRYQDIPAGAIPEVTEDDGTKARIICGEFWGKTGPVEGVAAESNVAARYVDISVPPFKRKRIKVETTRNAFAYVFAGSGTFRDASPPQAVLTESADRPQRRASLRREKPFARALRSRRRDRGPGRP